MAGRWFLGVDWGSRVHALCLLNHEGTTVGQATAPHEAVAFAATVQALLVEGGAVADHVQVAIEVPRGTLIDFFLDRGFSVYAINPKQLDRCRDRYAPAGAKDDRRDAWVLADALRTTPRAYRHLQPDAAWVVELRELGRLWDDLEGDRRRFANRLGAQLQRIEPALWALCPGADEPWLWALLDRAPTAAARRRLTEPEVQALLREYRVRRLTAVAVRTALQVPAFPVAPGVVVATERHMTALLPALRAVADARRQCRADLERLFIVAEEQSEHRDVVILRSLPGLGMWTAATMLGEAAQPLGARDYHRVRTLAGVAPVTKQSGKRRTVVMRRGCHQRLRQAMYHWARVSVMRDPDAHAYWHRLRSRGVPHATALRCVADRWLRILMAMLHTQTPYIPKHVVAA